MRDRVCGRPEEKSIETYSQIIRRASREHSIGLVDPSSPPTPSTCSTTTMPTSAASEATARYRSRRDIRSLDVVIESFDDVPRRAGLLEVRVLEFIDLFF